MFESCGVQQAQSIVTAAIVAVEPAPISTTFDAALLTKRRFLKRERFTRPESQMRGIGRDPGGEIIPTTLRARALHQLSFGQNASEGGAVVRCSESPWGCPFLG